MHFVIKVDAMKFMKLTVKIAMPFITEILLCIQEML